MRLVANTHRWSPVRAIVDGRRGSNPLRGERRADCRVLCWSVVPLSATAGLNCLWEKCNSKWAPHAGARLMNYGNTTSCNGRLEDATSPYRAMARVDVITLVGMPRQ